MNLTNAVAIASRLFNLPRRHAELNRAPDIKLAKPGERVEVSRNTTKIQWSDWSLLDVRTGKKLHKNTAPGDAVIELQPMQALRVRKGRFDSAGKDITVIYVCLSGGQDGNAACHGHGSSDNSGRVSCMEFDKTTADDE